MSAEPPRPPRRDKRRKRRWTKALRNALIGALGPPLVRLWLSTLRYRWVGFLVDWSAPSHPRCIYVFWHQRILGFTFTHRDQGARVLISSHADGEMIARVAASLGFVPVRGSSTRGGSRALRALLDEIGAGHDIAMTPDGPRGPRHVFQTGAVYLASRTGLPIVPCSIAYRRSWSLPTWDGFIVPAPFTAAAVQFGEPILVPADVEGDAIEDWRCRLEARLRAITEDTEARREEILATGVPSRRALKAGATLASPGGGGGGGGGGDDVDTQIANTAIEGDDR